ncbi:MAG: VUT family protein [Rickettsiales bacterium]|nr:MAG: VUT family protein [Rickettsiales bacterium]
MLLNSEGVSIMLKIKNFKYYNMITVIFIVCLITANMGATKLFQFGSLVLPGGIIVFPLLYVINDILTEVYGFTASRRVIWLALFSNLFFTLILYAIVYFPPAEHHSNQESYANIFGLTPRIFIASLSSYFIGELLNASTISTLKIMQSGKNFAARAIISTCIGALVETAIFAGIAFGAILPAHTLLMMVFTLTALKVLYELLVLPITVKITKYLKKVEGIDSYESPSLRGIFGW